jgi:hypothetical protein
MTTLIGKYLFMFFFIFLLAAERLSAQVTKDHPKKEKTEKFIEKIVGTWKLQSIVDNEKAQSKKGGQAISSQNIEESGNIALQILELERDGRYKANSASNALDSGSYRLNEQHTLLFLESDASDITPTPWSIGFKKNKLTLESRDGADDDNRFTYVYEKKKEGLKE